MKRNLWNARHTCTHCKAVMKKKRFRLEGVRVRAWECNKCKDTVLHPEDAQQVLLLNKLKRGLPVKIGELGTSLVVRIPKEIAELYKLSKGEQVLVKAEENRKIELNLT